MVKGRGRREKIKDIRGKRKNDKEEEAESKVIGGKEGRTAPVGVRNVVQYHKSA